MQTSRGMEMGAPESSIQRGNKHVVKVSLLLMGQHLPGPRELTLTHSSIQTAGPDSLGSIFCPLKNTQSALRLQKEV